MRCRLVTSRSAVLLPLAALVLGSCAGATSADDPASTDEPLSIAAAIEHGDGTVRVRGFVVADPQRARLCDLLLESFPPQCGGATLDLAGLEDLDTPLDEEGGVRWTPGPVVVTGTLTGDLLTATGVVDDGEP